MCTLNWLNKYEAVSAAKRSAYLLLEQVHKLFHYNPESENLLIQGDSLEATKTYPGQLKCIYVDPPYDARDRVFDEPNRPIPSGSFREIDTTAIGKGRRQVDISPKIVRRARGYSGIASKAH